MNNIIKSSFVILLLSACATSKAFVRTDTPPLQNSSPCENGYGKTYQYMVKFNVMRALDGKEITLRYPEIVFICDEDQATKDKLDAYNKQEFGH